MTDGMTKLNLSFIPFGCLIGKNTIRSEAYEKKSTFTKKNKKRGQEYSAEYKIAYS